MNTWVPKFFLQCVALLVSFTAGMCEAAFYSAGRGGAKVKIHGAKRGEGENPRGGAGPGEKSRKSTNSKILQKCENYNVVYYNINYNII